MEPHQIIEAYFKAPVSVRKEIAKLLKLDVIETIEDKLMNFGTIARSKSIPLYFNTPSGTDPDIVKLLPDATVSTIPAPQGKWKNVDTTNGTTEREMLETAMKMSLSQAIDIFNEMLASGVFDKLETYRIIFLKEKDANGNALGLVCDRGTGGELYLCLPQVSPGRSWDDSGGAWFQQK